MGIILGPPCDFYEDIFLEFYRVVTTLFSACVLCVASVLHGFPRHPVLILVASLPIGRNSPQREFAGPSSMAAYFPDAAA